MELTKIETSTPVELAKRMFFLAYQASSVMGMGMLQARDSITEDQVWENVTGSGDYAIARGDSKRPHADYVFGRMMKFSLQIEEDGITLPNRELRADYQSWCGTYPTYQALADAALAELA